MASQTVPAAGQEPAASSAGPSRGVSWQWLILTGYLLAAVVLTWRLWADPAARVVAGNPTDADLFAWFFRFEATALAHGQFPALVTSSLNAPTGINLMWNTSMLLPGIVLAPVTLAFGPQVSLTVLTTCGFAGSAASMLWVTRRWGAGLGAAAAAGAVYGFSPALVHASIGHYNLQFAVLPPLLIDATLRLFTRSGRPVRDGARLGLLTVAQLFISEELLLASAVVAALVLTALAIHTHRVSGQVLRTAPLGLLVAAAVTGMIAGAAFWTQFAGPLTQHGSAFSPDFYKNDLTGFVTPSRYMLFHTAASAASAAAFQGGAPEYLAYLGLPLLAAVVIAAVLRWRDRRVFAAGVTFAVLELLSLGAHPLVNGTTHQGVTLPWRWLEGAPVIGLALPDRFSLLADGAAAAVLGFGLDWVTARVRSLPGTWLAVTIAMAAMLPLVPLPLPARTVPPVPSGWAAVFGALRLPAGARVLLVPVPTATLTAPMRWQATTGQRIDLIGGYFQGPASGGQVYIGGQGPRATAVYLDDLWSDTRAPAPAREQVRADLAFWRPAAVVAYAVRRSPLGRYLTSIFGAPTVSSGRLLGWRQPLAR